MSRATDAFSSLISDVPGVDTSCFIKRSLNDLKTKEEGHKGTTPPAVDQTPSPRPTPPPTDFNFASIDLDALGKPAPPTAPSQPTAPFEDLFEHIPGCEETPFTLEEQTPSPAPTPARNPVTQETPLVPEMDSVNAASPPPPPRMTDDTPFSLDEGAVSNEEREWEMNEEAAGIELELSPSAPPVMLGRREGIQATSADESAARSSDLKLRFEKYKTSLNKKAGDLKKKGLRAMKHGLGAAQEWVDKYVEERKQTSAAVSQKKEDERQIEQFLMEIEQLSHYRREQLMSELPAEFFQKVMDYAEAKGRAIDHLFITGSNEGRPYEAETTPEAETEFSAEVSSEEPDRDQSDEPEFLTVTGDESLEAAAVEEEEDFDLLGLSTPTPEQPVPSSDARQDQPLSTPDDLVAFFATSQGSNTDLQPSADQTSAFYGEDLMEFEGGAAAKTKSDYRAMYQQLKNAGAHSEEEIRAILKQKRQQEKENKMASALQAKVDREREEEQTQELLYSLKEKHMEKIVAWKEKHANNMRGLLTSLQSVLWEDSGWKTLSVADVLEPVQVKKAYMKANLIIHPDKVKQKGGSPEQVVLADMVFNVLKEGWQKFQT